MALVSVVTVFRLFLFLVTIPHSIGPIAQYRENSKYYSAIKPAANPKVDAELPHITIQLTIYKERFESVMYVHAYNNRSLRSVL